MKCFFLFVFPPVVLWILHLLNIAPSSLYEFWNTCTRLNSTQGIQCVFWSINPPCPSLQLPKLSGLFPTHMLLIFHWWNKPIWLQAPHHDRFFVFVLVCVGCAYSFLLGQDLDQTALLWVGSFCLTFSAAISTGAKCKSGISSCKNTSATPGKSEKLQRACVYNPVRLWDLLLAL